MKEKLNAVLGVNHIYIVKLWYISVFGRATATFLGACCDPGLSSRLWSLSRRACPANLCSCACSRAHDRYISSPSSSRLCHDPCLCPVRCAASNLHGTSSGSGSVSVSSCGAICAVSLNSSLRDSPSETDSSPSAAFSLDRLL